MENPIQIHSPVLLESTPSGTGVVGSLPPTGSQRFPSYSPRSSKDRATAAHLMLEQGSQPAGLAARGFGITSAIRKTPGRHNRIRRGQVTEMPCAPHLDPPDGILSQAGQDSMLMVAALMSVPQLCRSGDGGCESWVSEDERFLAAWVRLALVIISTERRGRPSHPQTRLLAYCRRQGANADWKRGPGNDGGVPPDARGMGMATT
ncbi:hypothetical protein GGTG_07998 [Gaeumannomyces tritici R3-111a-1]|uniref:Uncharacterized protein n=1 Tax=Gaeumannomyces tritici (strain R3-111a-1) TaxID=644352 RepID=J3P3B0_GAET3|nr:hypothetical protein GGTG_07998 [Gaeumannomyces tritici R3-111a-1]EJT74152.1 hypothetical protein GGTG_07998 [Gaeumannomyces tritici R3-111a-1]